MRGAQVGELFFAQRADALQLRDDDRTLEDEFVALLVVERDRPAAELVVAFRRIDQMTEERITPHLAIGDHVQARLRLQGNGFIDGAIFDLLELGIADLARAVSLARFLQISRAQQTAHHITAIGWHADLLCT